MTPAPKLRKILTKNLTSKNESGPLSISPEKIMRSIKSYSKSRRVYTSPRNIRRNKSKWSK